jgi:hypothetical protein
LTCCCPSCPPLFSHPIPSAKSHWSCWSKAELWTGQRHAKAHCPTRNQIIKKKNRVKIVYAGRPAQNKNDTHTHVSGKLETDGWICRARQQASKLYYPPSLASAVLCAGRVVEVNIYWTTPHAVGGPSAGLVGYATNQPRAAASRKSTKRVFTQFWAESYWNRGSRHLYLCEKGKQKWRAQKVFPLLYPAIF